MRSRLLVPGLLLLGASLLVALLTASAGTSGRVQVAAMLGWFAQAALYVGAGLTVAGAVLHELRSPEPERSEPLDHYDG